MRTSPRIAQLPIIILFKFTMKTETNSTALRTAKSWDTYWQGTGDVGAFSAGGASHPAVLIFWEEFFRTVKRKYDAPLMIDLASGNGALVERALGEFGEAVVDITSVDLSDAAIANIGSRFPAVRGLVSDVRTIPLESGRFDIVTSQFGVEYAGLEAIDEAARLLAPGGVLALMLHNQEGSIHRECKEALDAIRRVEESGFIPNAMEMMRTGFEGVRGADRVPYDAAAKQLAPAVQVLEEIMQQYGEHVAGDTVARLYSDMGRIHSRIQHYDPSEVLDWLKKMEEELGAYAGRMSSMSECAIDSKSFDRICAGLRERDCRTQTAGPLVAPGHDLPLAWVVVAER
jgi:SAM-dependent methyltransferase